MSNEIDTERRSACATTAAWLRAAGSALGAAGLGAAAIAAARLLGAPTAVAAAAAWAVLMVAAMERLLALRVRFDAELFARLADATLELDGLDRALEALGLRQSPPGASSRPLDERVAGARRLVMRHAAVVVVQGVLVALLLGT